MIQLDLRIFFKWVETITICFKQMQYSERKPTLQLEIRKLQTWHF